MDNNDEREFIKYLSEKLEEHEARRNYWMNEAIKTGEAKEKILDDFAGLAYEHEALKKEQLKTEAQLKAQEDKFEELLKVLGQESRELRQVRNELARRSVKAMDDYNSVLSDMAELAHEHEDLKQKLKDLIENS